LKNYVESKGMISIQRLSPVLQPKGWKMDLPAYKIGSGECTLPTLSTLLLLKTSNLSTEWITIESVKSCCYFDKHNIPVALYITD
jgi:phage-related protein